MFEAGASSFSGAAANPIRARMVDTSTTASSRITMGESALANKGVDAKRQLVKRLRASCDAAGDRHDAHVTRLTLQGPQST